MKFTGIAKRLTYLKKFQNYWIVFCSQFFAVLDGFRTCKDFEKGYAKILLINLTHISNVSECMSLDKFKG